MGEDTARGVPLGAATTEQLPLRLAIGVVIMPAIVVSIEDNVDMLKLVEGVLIGEGHANPLVAWAFCV